jgi:hypothetical protein
MACDLNNKRAYSEINLIYSLKNMTLKIEIISLIKCKYIIVVIFYWQLSLEDYLCISFPSLNLRSVWWKSLTFEQNFGLRTALYLKHCFI